MVSAKESLSKLEAHERECAIRYEYIEKRLDEGSAKFKRLETLIWGVYPFIVGTVVLAKYF
jgi:hypothetical protein|tara:strand:- start:211 stop:393 length:183 start_codon:yes stop_codon:yes gene_type:complete